MCGQYRLRGKVIVKYDEETEEFIGNVEQLEGEIANLTKTAQTPGGISLFKDKDKTTYKSTYELLKEISGVYHDLTDKQQAGLLEALAGKRGGQVLAGVLDDFSEVDRAMTEMKDSAGAADAEMGIIRESIDYKLNALKQTWINVLQQMTDRGQIGTILDGLTGISEALGFIIDKVGVLGLGSFGLEGFLMSQGLGFVDYDKESGNFGGLIHDIFGSKDFSQDTQEFVEYIKSAGESLNALQVEEKAKEFTHLDASIVDVSKSMVGASFNTAEYEKELSKAQKAMSNFSAIGKSLMSFGANMLATAAIDALIQVLYAFADAQQHVMSIASNFGESLKSTNVTINDYKTRISTLNETLRSETSSTEQKVQARKDLFNIQKDLLEQYGKEPSAVNDINTIITTATDVMGDYKDVIDKTTESWATLGNVAYEEAKRIADSEDKWYNKLVNYVQHGTISSTEAALDKYENYGKYGEGFVAPGGRDEQSKEMRSFLNDIDISQGNADEILDKYEKILAKAKSLGMENQGWVSGVKSNIDEIKTFIESVEPIRNYQAGVEVENTAFYHNANTSISALYDDYNKAIADNKISLADKLKKDIVSQLQDVEKTATESGKQNVAKWFEDTFSEFKGDVETANLEQTLKQTVVTSTINALDGSKNEVRQTYEDYFEDLLGDIKINGRVVNTEELQNMINLDSIDGLRDNGFTDEQIQAYHRFASAVTEADYSIENVVKHFSEMKTIESKALQDAKIKFSIDDTALNEAYTELDEYTDALKKEQQDAAQLGVNLSRTVFGNVDTSTREALKWTESNLEKFKDELYSWNENPEDLRNTVSTVLGTSWDFDGLEIAFTPMLQTDQGLELLSSETVESYITQVLQKTNGDYSLDKILELDSEGLIVDGKKIKNIIADVGETAEKTSQSMHFTGINGSIQLLNKGIDEVEEKIQNLSVDKWLESLSEEDLEILNTIDFSNVKEGTIDVSLLEKALYKAKQAVVDVKEETEEGWSLKSTIEKYKIDADAFNAYLETFGKLHPVLAQNQEDLEKTAIANYRLSIAANDLKSNIDGYVENIEKFGKSSVEYDTAIQNLSNDLSALTGQDITLTDAAVFAEDKNRLELLKKAVDGNSTALKELKRVAKDANAVLDNAFNVSDSISKLKDLKSNLELVGQAVANIDFKGRVQLDDLDSIADYFIGLDETTYNLDAVNNALQLLGEGRGTVQEQADAFNTLADQIFKTSGVLDDLTAKNAYLKVIQLKRMGITNAEAVVNQALSDSIDNVVNKEIVNVVETQKLAAVTSALEDKDEDLIDESVNVVNAYLDQQTASEGTRAAVWDLITAQGTFNNTKLDVNDKVKALEDLANAYLGTATAAKYSTEFSELERRASENKKFSNNGAGGMPSEVIKAQKEQIIKDTQELSDKLKEEITKKNKVNFETIKYNGGKPVQDRTGKEENNLTDAINDVHDKAIADEEERLKKLAEEEEKATKEAEDTYDEFFDYFERRVKVCSDAISLLNAYLEDVVGSAAKNQLLDAQERIYNMQKDEYDSAQRMYEMMAEKALAKIPDNLKNDVKNGAIAIDEFIGKGNEEVVKAIQEYQKWADKVADCKQQLAQLREQIRQLELKRFKNIAQDWQDLFDLRQNNAIDLIDKQIALFEEAGELIGDEFYKEQRRQAEAQYDLLKNEREALIGELNHGLGNGSIEVGTDEWQEIINTLSDLEGKILDCQTAIEKYDNAILNIHTEVFDRIQDQFDDMEDQLSDMEDFLSDEKVGDKFGNWSDEGAARAGLLAQNYELAQKRVQDYGKEIEWLNDQYNQGKYSTIEYTEKLADLMSKQRDAAKSAEDYKKSIVDLNKARIDIQIEGINEEIDAYEKLIQAELDALKASKDLHDYKKQIADENKAILDIQKQLAAMENDNTAATTAKRKKLEAQLAEAQGKLSETEYDHSIDSQIDALDEQMEQYRQQREAEITALQEYAEQAEQVLTDVFEMIKANAISIGETITVTAQEHGIQISDALTTAWQAGENAIASYGFQLSASSSEFIANLNDVEANTWQLQEQANQTSESLSNMFANRADNLVEELQRSWESEANVDYMTHALQDSFVNAINTGMRFNQLVNPLREVENAANQLRDAVNEATDALRINEQAAKDARNAEEEYWRKYEEGGHYIDMNDFISQRPAPYEPPYKSHYETGNYRTIKYPGHAKGLTKAEQDELAWTQELGDEVIISPTRSSILTPIKKGDAVLTAAMTENLWELAKINPKDLVKGVDSSNIPTIQQNKAISLNFGSAVSVSGNVNDTMSMMKIASQEAQSKIAQTLKNLSDEMKY